MALVCSDNPADLLRLLTDFVASIHRVVSSVVEEITDIVFFEYFQQSLVIGIVDLFRLEFIADGTDIRDNKIVDDDIDAALAMPRKFNKELYQTATILGL